MSTKRHILSAVVAAALTGLTALPAAAQTRAPAAESNMAATFADETIYRLEAQRSISPAEAKSVALRRVPGGEVVDISRRGDTYRVRVIAKNGKVVDVYIDANTGRVKR